MFNIRKPKIRPWASRIYLLSKYLKGKWWVEDLVDIHHLLGEYLGKQPKTTYLGKVEDTYYLRSMDHFS